MCQQSVAEDWEAHLTSVLPVCWGAVVSSSLTCSRLLLQLPRSQLLQNVEVVSQRAREQRRKNRIYTLVFWKLESREKLKNVTWGQNVWLSNYRAELHRFIPTATLWPMFCWELCGGFRGASPSPISFLQCCGRKGITEGQQHCKKLVWNRVVYSGALYIPR